MSRRGTAETAEVSIRQANVKDFDLLRAMWIEFEDYLNAIHDAVEIVPSRFEAMRTLAFSAEPMCTILIAEVDGSAAGYLVYYVGVHMDDLATAYYVADLFVRVEYQRKGVGTALMLAVRTRAAATGATKVFWTVWRKNTRAIEFYKRLGSEPFEEKILMVWSVGGYGDAKP